MPTRETGEHQQKSRSNETEVEETPAASANASARRDAEEFVRGFVQKGGQ